MNQLPKIKTLSKKNKIEEVLKKDIKFESTKHIYKLYVGESYLSGTMYSPDKSIRSGSF